MSKDNHRSEVSQDEDRKPFEEPKLTYVTPVLKEHGKVEDVTKQSEGGFFGTFSP